MRQTGVSGWRHRRRAPPAGGCNARARFLVTVRDRGNRERESQRGGRSSTSRDEDDCRFFFLFIERPSDGRRQRVKDLRSFSPRRSTNGSLARYLTHLSAKHTLVDVRPITGNELYREAKPCRANQTRENAHAHGSPENWAFSFPSIDVEAL